MRTTSLLSALLPLTVAAQTVLSYPNAIPAIGAYPVETRSYGVVPNMAQSGSGVVWDLTTASYSIVGTTTDSVLTPADTPYANDYPQADIAVRLVDQFGYYTVDQTRVLDLGYRPSAASPSFIYSDPAQIVSFPSAVGDEWADATLSGATATTLTVTILAQGEIRLADGVIPDAILVRRHYAGASLNATSITWFRSSDALRPLGNLLANGGVIIRAPQQLTTALHGPTPASFPILAPNPCNGHTTLFKPTDGLTHVRVFDPAGRICSQVETRTVASALDLSACPDGWYVVEITQNGQRIVERLVIMR
jgi:hypothetical protein